MGRSAPQTGSRVPPICRTWSAATRIEPGASLVETAIVLPLLLFLMVSFLELGVFVQEPSDDRQHRPGRHPHPHCQGDDPDADCTTIERIIETVSAGADPAGIVLIEIYRAAGDGTQLAAQTNASTFVGGDRSDCTRWSGPVLYPTGEWPRCGGH